MWPDPDYYSYLLSDEWYNSPWIPDEVTYACQRPPALCDIQQAGVRRMYGTGAWVRGFLTSRWKTTSRVKGR